MTPQFELFDRVRSTCARWLEFADFRELFAQFTGTSSTGHTPLAHTITMHTRWLKIFCDVVDHGSFSQAAEVNGVSQSNASQVVHQLEDRLGVQLIDRSKRPFVLTPEGHKFHEGARVIVQRYDDLEREVRSLHQVVVSRLTVASIYSVGLAHMSRYLREFLGANPQADIRLEYLHPHRVYEAVDSGQADLGLISYPEESKSLAAIPWRTEPMVLVCHPEHPLAGKSSVALARAAGRSRGRVPAGPGDPRRNRPRARARRRRRSRSRSSSTTSKRSSGRWKSAPA